MSVGDIYQVSIRYTMAAQRLVTVLHFVVSSDLGAPTVEKEQALADSVADTTNPANFMSQLLAILPEDCIVDAVRAQTVYPERLAYRTAPVGLPGTDTASNAPPIDVCITKRTDHAGRDQVGTIHMPGVPAGRFEDGLLDPDYKVDVLDCWDTLMDLIHLADTNLELVIAHNPIGAGLFDLVTEMQVQPEVRVMQRRVVGRGE
jgi:hypothetical protein